MTLNPASARLWGCRERYVAEREGVTGLTRPENSVITPVIMRSLPVTAL